LASLFSPKISAAFALEPRIKVGVFTGPCGAVPTSPITLDLTVLIGLAPSLSSMTSTPCKN